MSANDDKRIQPIDSIEAYAYGTWKTNPCWPQILCHVYRILKLWGSGSGKTNALLNLIKNQDGDNCSIIGVICLYAKDPNEKKSLHLIIQYLVKNDHVNPKDPKPFIEYSNSMQDLYKNIED